MFFRKCVKEVLFVNRNRGVGFMEKKSIDISFIIPVYNISNYLTKCLESLLRQTGISREIILINDGSTDNSIDVCRSFERKHKCISVIDKKNEGVSIARNIGIKKAQGEYICFVDGDDFYIENCVSVLLNEAKNNNLDIVRGKYKRFDGQLLDESYPKNTVCDNEVLSGGEYLKRIMKNRESEVVPWLGLFRRSFLLENDIIFPAGITYTEDQLFFLKALLSSECKIIDVDIAFYGYRIRKGSATQGNYSQKKVEDIFYIVDRELELARKAKKNEKEIISFVSTTLSQVFMFYKLGGSEEKRYIEKIVSHYVNFDMVINAYNTTIRIKLLLSKYLPILLRILYK